MASSFLSILILVLTYYFSNQKNIESDIIFLSSKLKDKNPNYSNLKEWLNQLVIDIPNELLENTTHGIIDNIVLYDINLDKIITTSHEVLDNNILFNISITNIESSFKAILTLFDLDKTLSAHVSRIGVFLPINLTLDNETGLISEIDTNGLNIDLDNLEIEIDLQIGDLMRNIVINVLKEVLLTIKESILEDSLKELMNTKIGELFQKANDLILNGVEPKQLNISLKEEDIADIKKSSLISAVGYLFNKLIGAEGPLNINSLVNIITRDTGIIQLHEFYNKSIHFELNITNKNDTSLGYLDMGLEDLNISGLNTWKNFTILEPYDKILLNSYTHLQNLTIDILVSLKMKLDTISGLEGNETILYEKAYLRTNLINNTLKGFIQLPINNKKSSLYSDKECLTLDCITDLADANGTGITAFSLNETFTYIILDIVEKSSLENDLEDTIDKIINLFISNFDDKIPLFINALLNKTAINFVNEKINNYLYSTSCPGLPDEEVSEVNKLMTTIAFISAFFLFIIIIFFPYILGKACKSDSNVINKLQTNNTTIISESKDEKGYYIEPQYCMPGISIQCIKELGRTDPIGASLFLHPQIPLFWKIFIPLAIVCTIALFISSNSGTGASVYIAFQVGRRIQIPSLFDFGLINSVRDMWKAGAYILSVFVAVFSGIWPYLKLLLMIMSFVLPTSLYSESKRANILRILDATGKWSILDSYVMTLMLVAFHFHIAFPVVEPSEAEESTLIDVFVKAAFGFFTLILGTIISLCLSHIITFLHKSLDEHPDQNKGEKAESYTALISFADNKYLGKNIFRILISILLFLTLGLVLVGSNITSFSFNFHGLAELALELFEISSQRDYSVLELGYKVPDAAENPNDFIIRYTQVIFLLTVFVMPVAMLLTVIFVWFFPLPRKAQKFFYAVIEILNAWSCLDVFVLSIIAAITEIGTFTEFIVGDKCDAINPFIGKYFDKKLDGHNTCFEVQAYLREGCWLLFVAAIIFFITSNYVMKVCRNALDERLPDHVKEYLQKKNNAQKISFNDDIDNREGLLSNSERISNINNTRISNINNTRISTNNTKSLDDELDN